MQSYIYRTKLVRYVPELAREGQRMFRISRITDYGIVILSHLAQNLAHNGDDSAHNSRELAEQTQLPAPVVSKILKSLTRAGLLDSIRGSKGGYRLARPPAQISVVQMITALEGPVAMTECRQQVAESDEPYTVEVMRTLLELTEQINSGFDLEELLDHAYESLSPILQQNKGSRIAFYPPIPRHTIHRGSNPGADWLQPWNSAS